MVHVHSSSEDLNKTAEGGIHQNHKDNDLATNNAAYSINLMSTPGLGEDDCQNVWMHGSNGTCQCGESVHASVSCNSITNRIAVLRCHCMTYDSIKGVILSVWVWIFQ